MTCDLIDIGTCVSILKRFGDRDNAEDIELVRYFLTDNSLIVKIKYRGVDLKCEIDKLAFVDGEVPDAPTIQDFADVYLKPYGKVVLPITGEEEEEPAKIQLSLSQV